MSNLNIPSDHPAAKGNVVTLLTAFAGYSVLIGGVVGLAVFIRRSIEHYDFTNLLNTDAEGVFRLLVVAAAPVALFLLFQSVIRLVHKGVLSITMRAAMLLAGAFFTYFIGVFLLPAAEQNNLAFAVGGGLVLTAVFDYFTERQATSFAWTILALMLFSAFSASIFWQNSSDRDQKIRFECAQALAEPRDTIYAERQLSRLHQAIEQDGKLPFLMKIWPIKPNSDTVKTYINQLIFNEKYLFRHYSLTVHAFDREEDDPLFIDQKTPRSAINKEWEAAKSITAHPNLRTSFAPDGANRYILRCKVERMKDPNHPVEVFCLFDQRYPQTTQVYSQIFDDQSFKNLSALHQYDYAVMNGNRLVAEQGNVHPQSLAIRLPNGQTAASPAVEHADAVSISADGTVRAVVGRKAMGILQPIYLFCILFGIATGILLLLGLLSRLVSFKFTLLPSVKGSLSRRIHFSYLGLLAAGFIVIGTITYSHFSKSSQEAAQKEIDQHANAALTYLRLSAAMIAPQSDSVSAILGPQLAQFAQSLNIDADLFDAQGKTRYSTREDLRRIGILPTAMNGEGKTALDNGNAQADITSTLENHTFKVRYLAIKNLNQQTVAYFGLPYNENTQGITREISDFIGMLAGIYVFLLLIAAVVTYFVSNSITRPLNSIAQKIKAVQLEDKNQALEYEGDSNDEISKLVIEYNRMVDKLEDSKVKLVKLERESAWRDMARQIAHDIKNPLTTMKLSMQHLERVSNDPIQAAAYLKRATGRMIEQIDSLAQTASEFSMFANLDRTPRSPVAINDIVESVYDLFTEQKDVVLSLELPDEKYMVSADKNHLLRVFNNLVINAIQAIPSDREGIVKVALLRVGNNAVIKISDNGGGIPQEIRERVFEPNFTTKTSGSGLGLAICKKIIEAHDGDIRFETKDNEGTEFFIDLPII